ncbi:D-alanine--D-alanine ligase [Porticoccaceae bacterium LTM1]|nr:D-alanine--D-alanine ligase [Porticoccaceae bacterium LTM1]
MSMIKDQLGRVGVIYGGSSAESAISLKSGKAVHAALLRAGVDAVAVEVGDRPLQTIADVEMDRAVLMLHGTPGEDGTIQGALELMGIPYTGCGVLTSALAMDKWRCKQLWQGMGLPTAAFAMLEQDTDWSAVMAELGGVAMVKPANEGSSVGMYRAESAQELQDAWQKASQYGQVMAERWITGSEYTVAILNGRVLPPIKLETDHGFYDYDAKYVTGDTRYLIPCGLEGDDLAALEQVALAAYNSLGCSGCSRVDVMRDTDGQFLLLEVNTIPGMTDTSLVPKAAAAVGISFEELVVEIAKTSLEA